MAKVFKVYGTVQRGRAGAEWPWATCVQVLKLDEMTRTEDRPKFGDKDTTPWPTNIVVELETAEATAVGIKPGFFVSPLDPDEVQPFLND